MPATSQPAIEAKLRELMAALELDLGPGELRRVSPAQAALLDWFRAHPFSTIHELEIHNGDPKTWEEQRGAVTEKFRA